jgi:hypothetical protein
LASVFYREIALTHGRGSKEKARRRPGEGQEKARRRPGEGQEKARFFRCKDAQTRQNEANNVQDLAQSLTALQDKAAQDVVYFLDFLFKISFRLEREGI